MLDYLAFVQLMSEWSLVAQPLWQFVSWMLVEASQYPVRYPVYCACALASTLMYVLSRRPINYVRDLSAIGFDYLTSGMDKKSARKLVRDAIRRRALPEDLPPVYPNGWIPILESQYLKRGQVKPISAIGEEFAVFRSEEGKVSVVDAFCPHLGAHLGVGGMVKGDCIECPFHGWQFRGSTGSCVRVPYSKQVPEFAKIKTWPSCEENGLIFVWYHAESEPPSWTVPPVPEIRDGIWSYRGRSEHTVNCHIQEIPENGADAAHLNELHRDSLLTGGRPWDFGAFWRGLIRHTWGNTWNRTEKEPHVISITLDQTVSVAGIKANFLGFKLDIKQVGPAVVHLNLSTYLGRGVFMQVVTPLGPLRQRIVHHFYAESRIPRIISNLMIRGEAAMLERDVAVWNNKRLLRSPLLVSEDRFIAKYRRWFGQFFSDNSPKLQDLRNKSMDW